MGEVVAQWVGIGLRVESGVPGALMPSRWVLRTQVPQRTPEPTSLKAAPWTIDAQLPMLNPHPLEGS